MNEKKNIVTRDQSAFRYKLDALRAFTRVSLRVCVLDAK